MPSAPRSPRRIPPRRAPAIPALVAAVNLESPFDWLDVDGAVCLGCVDCVDCVVLLSGKVPKPSCIVLLSGTVIL